VKSLIQMALIFSVLGSVSATVSAQEGSVDYKAKVEQQVGLEVSAIADAPVDGLVQVNTSKGLFYISENGEFLLQARIYNIDKGMRNETELALGKIRKEGISQFSDSAIEFKAKDEKHVITVFTDITCGYCRKLHKEVGELNDMGITVRYLAFPRNGLSSKTYQDMVSVWCADDPKAAMTSAKSGSSVPTAQCKNDVSRQFNFGQQIGVNGTPNIILEDGTLIPGYQPAAVLEQALNQAG